MRKPMYSSEPPQAGEFPTYISRLPGELCQLPVRRHTRLYKRDWVQGREWICRLVTKEFTRNHGPVPMPSSSQVSSLSTWLGRQVHVGFSLFLFLSSEFWIPFCTWALQQSVHCSLTAFWKSGVFWLLSDVAETICQVKRLWWAGTEFLHPDPG